MLVETIKWEHHNDRRSKYKFHSHKLLFRQFLKEEGIRNEVESAAIKRVLAWQFEEEMENQHKTKQGMARELKTSRSQLDRLLDPENTAVTLEILTRAANILCKRLVLEIQDKQ